MVEVGLIMSGGRSSSAITVDLKSGQSFGGEGNDTLKSIELILGSNFLISFMVIIKIIGLELDSFGKVISKI